jgi:hypothetical protein
LFRFVEDYIKLLYICPDFLQTDWDKKFIQSVGQAAYSERPVSTAQSASCVRLIKKYKQQILTMPDGPSEAEIDRILISPKHAVEVYQTLDYPREVRYLGQNTLAFRCKSDDNLKLAIKRLGGREFGAISYHFDSKSWIVQVHSKNIARVKEIISYFDFNFDDDVIDFLTEMTNTDQISAAETDIELGIIAVDIPDCPQLVWFIKEVLMGEGV